jgi:hypothetical protein
MGGIGYMQAISATRGHLDLKPLGWQIEVHGSLVCQRSGKTATIARMAACAAWQLGQTPSTAWLVAAGALGSARRAYCSAFVKGS